MTAADLLLLKVTNSIYISTAKQTATCFWYVTYDMVAMQLLTPRTEAFTISVVYTIIFLNLSQSKWLAWNLASLTSNCFSLKTNYFPFFVSLHYFLHVTNWMCLSFIETQNFCPLSFRGCISLSALWLCKHGQEAQWLVGNWSHDAVFHSVQWSSLYKPDRILQLGPSFLTKMRIDIRFSTLKNVQIVFFPPWSIVFWNNWDSSGFNTDTNQALKPVSEFCAFKVVRFLTWKLEALLTQEKLRSWDASKKETVKNKQSAEVMRSVWKHKETLRKWGMWTRKEVGKCNESHEQKDGWRSEKSSW